MFIITVIGLELPSDFLDNLLGTSRRSPKRSTAGAATGAGAAGADSGAAMSASLDFPVAGNQAGADDALPC